MAVTKALSDVVGSGWLTSGPVVAEFEERFAEHVGASYAVSLNSCTAALHLALLANDVGPGDEVIVPTLTFAATAEVVLAVGATVVLVDCEPDTLCLDVEQVEGLIGDRTRAVMPMHYGGGAADMRRLTEVLRATDSDVAVVEDAAHAFPTESELGKVGSLDTSACFSFYANKTITTGEGGMLTTNDPDIAQRARQLSLHGLSRDAWRRFETRTAWDYDIAMPGWKYNMTDVAAALGIEQLKVADSLAAQRRALARRYALAFQGVELIRTRLVVDWEKDSAHLFTIQLVGDIADHRNRLVDELRDREIGSSVHYRPLHMHSLYRDLLATSDESFPNSANFFHSALSLPIYPRMTFAEQDRVIEAILDFVAAHEP
jgi:perosamine synthetase